MPVGAGMNRPARAGLAVFIAWNPRRGELLMNAAPLALKKLHAAKRPQAVAWDDHAKCQECRGVPTRFCLSIAYKRAMSQSHTEPERTPETRSSDDEWQVESDRQHMAAQHDSPCPRF